MISVKLLQVAVVSEGKGGIIVSESCQAFLIKLNEVLYVVVI